MTELIIRGAEQEQLTRLWDAISWLDSWEPEAVAAMEGKFGFSAHNRTVNAHNPQTEKRDD